MARASDMEPLPLHLFCQGSIIVSHSYDFWKRQAICVGVDERYRLHIYAASLMAELISRFEQSGMGTTGTVIDVDVHTIINNARRVPIAKPKSEVHSQFL